nr:hypothetical protein [Tanacetum cinerariifolium]
ANFVLFPAFSLAFDTFPVAYTFFPVTYALSMKTVQKGLSHILTQTIDADRAAKNFQILNHTTIPASENHSSSSACHEERAEVYYECKDPFKSFKCLWVRSKSIAATWLEKVVTPFIEPAIKYKYFLRSGRIPKNLLDRVSQLHSRSQTGASQSRQT